MLIFISGPLSAPSIEQQEVHVQRAMLAMWEVFRRGHLPVCPHLTHYFDTWAAAFLGDTPTYEQYMALALEQVRRSDALLSLGASPGADRELDRAWEWGKVVYRSVDEIPVRQ